MAYFVIPQCNMWKVCDMIVYIYQPNFFSCVIITPSGANAPHTLPTSHGTWNKCTMALKILALILMTLIPSPKSGNPICKYWIKFSVDSNPITSPSNLPSVDRVLKQPIGSISG